ncbi:MAG: ParB N-terminal domain-containing protein [Fibrobacter sp.]|nr:ParB N-terminal domain-containing protein [Fibrobacter sp.]
MEIIDVEIGKVKPYERNPRNNKEAVEKVANSIKEFGFKQPIVVDSENVIIAGHTRLLAAKKLGMDKVPVVFANDLTPEQVRMYRLADNKVAEFSEWDIDLLKAELQSLDGSFNFADFGFGDFFCNEPTGDDSDFDVDDAMQSIVDPVTQLGDIWKLGRHRLICGDSCDESTVKRLLDGNMVDLYLTDPPYNVAYKGSTGLTIENDNMDSDSFLAFLTDAFVAADSVMKKGCPFYVWHPSCEVMNFLNAICNVPGWMQKQYLIWAKDNFTLGRQDYQWAHEPCWYGWKDGAAHYFIDDRTKSTVLEFPKPRANKVHPTMKPVELWEEIINNSCREGEIVFDSFGGSGTTIIAAENTRRTGFCCELDPKYCDVIVQRFENLTGTKAELIKKED